MTRMYLNVNGIQPTNSNCGPAHFEDGSCTTPDIINSLMTMTNVQPIPQNCQPLSPDNKDCSPAMDSYESSQYCNISQQQHQSQKLPNKLDEDELHGYDRSNNHLEHSGNNHLDQHQHLQYDSSPSHSSSESYGSPCASPSSTPSIQATRTHLIKESLKVTIQSKRFANGQMLPSMDSSSGGGFYDELTPEDEDRRRRRRERNKVAATKCRNKKKERTIHLMMESETLEQTNLTLRTEIQRLEGEKQRLLDMLTYHMPACSMQSINQGIYYNNVNSNSLSIMGQ